MICNNCEHSCHCSNGGQCPIEDCGCLNCEHNPLDEFWKDLKKSTEDYAGAMINLTKHKD